LNPSWEELRDRDGAFISDGAFQFRLTTFYITPAAQIAQLLRSGFARVKVVSLRTGDLLEGKSLAACTDPWLYYLCDAA
jgi:hypothetical protein